VYLGDFFQPESHSDLTPGFWVALKAGTLLEAALIVVGEAENMCLRRFLGVCVSLFVTFNV